MVTRSHLRGCDRIANVGSKQSIRLEDIVVQYWFNGPEGIALDPGSLPDSLFQLVCSDATTGAALMLRSPTQQPLFVA